MSSNYVSPADVRRNLTVLIVALVSAFLALIGLAVYTEPARTREMEKSRDSAMKKWAAWENWASQNCTLMGERDIPGRGGLVSLLEYSCKDGKVYGIAHSQFLAAKACSKADLNECYGSGFPEAPVSWPGAENRDEFLR